MTCLQACSFKRNDRIGGPWLKGLPRSIKDSFSALWFAILYASVAGFAVLAIDASDGGRPTVAMWFLCSVAPPVTTSLLILIEAFLQVVTGRNSPR